MNTTIDILKQADTRAQETAQAARAQERTIIDAMRDEIGEPHYLEAKTQLPILAKAIETVYNPFLQHVARLAMTPGAPPMPDAIRRAHTEIGTLCAAGPTQTQNGITAYEGLSVRQMLMPDRRTIDGNLRGTLVAQIRADLRSWDGMAGAMENDAATVQNFIRDTGWPAPY